MGLLGPVSLLTCGDHIDRNSVSVTSATLGLSPVQQPRTRALTLPNAERTDAVNDGFYSKSGLWVLCVCSIRHSKGYR